MKPLNYDTPVIDIDGSIYPLGSIKSDISALFGTPQIIIDDTNEYVSGEVYVLFTAPKRGMLYVAPVLNENAWGSLNINGIAYSKYYTVSRMRCPMTIPLNKDDVVTFVLGGGSAQEMFVSFR